jgi:hypothetical protein
MKVTGLDIHFHEDSKGEHERGPVYGTVPLPDSLLLSETLTQAMPCRRELVELRKKSERAVAAYELVVWYFLAANQELGEKNKEVESLKADYNRLHEATRCILPLVEKPFQTDVDRDLYVEAKRLVELGAKAQSEQKANP